MYCQQTTNRNKNTVMVYINNASNANYFNFNFYQVQAVNVFMHNIHKIKIILLHCKLNLKHIFVIVVLREYESLKRTTMRLMNYIQNLADCCGFLKGHTNVIDYNDTLVNSKMYK